MAQHDADLADLAREQKVVRARPALPKAASTVTIATAASRKAAADKAAKDARDAVAKPAPVQAPAAVNTPAAVSPKSPVAPAAKVTVAPDPAVNEAERLRLFRAGVAPPMTRQGGVCDVSGNVRPLGGRFMTDAPAPFIGPLRRPAAVDSRPYSVRMAAHFRETAK